MSERLCLSVLAFANSVYIVLSCDTLGFVDEKDELV